MLAKRMILGYMFFIIFISAIIYISGIEILPGILSSLLIYCLIAFILHRIYAYITGKNGKDFFEFFIIFFYKLSFFVSILVLTVLGFVVFHTHIKPATMTKYTITNGEKTLMFQTMSHVASQSFYSKVQENILAAKKNGYVLFFEGVRPGTQENKEKFDQALGIALSHESYNILARLYGVVAQNNQDFLGIYNQEDFNVDLSIDEIIEIYESKKNNLPEISESKPELQAIYNIEENALKSLENLNKKELFLLRYFNQSIMNFMIQHEAFRNFVLQAIGRDDIFGVILDERNEFLTQEIISSEHEKIFIIYGLMHFSGVYELLKKEDKNWRIIQESHWRVIEPAGMLP